MCVSLDEDSKLVGVEFSWRDYAFETPTLVVLKDGVVVLRAPMTKKAKSVAGTKIIDSIEGSA